MFFPKVLTVPALNLLSLPAAFAQNNTQGTGTVSLFTCNPGYPVSSSEQSIIFTNFLRKFYVKKNVTRAVQEHILLDAINQNPNVAGNRDDSLAWVAPRIATWNITIVNTGFADNVGWSHVKVEGEGMGRYTVAPPANRTNPLELV